MNYFGEHLWAGQLGHFLVVLSLVASLIATISYFKSTNAKIPADANSWKRLGRISFVSVAISIFIVFAIIYAIIAKHYFEYFYVWNHSDKSLDASYLLSSIWEGQEGSFLLWALWHSVLGLILLRTSKSWEAPVMAVISFAQVCLASMILGLYIFDIKIGSTPFLLLRNSEIMTNAPMFFDVTTGALRQDYLALIKDGVGLNQLLQNYWMVIHPPILFLGFASTIVPFAYAIGGLWKKDFGGWTKEAMPWSLFSVGILGLGIMMGAKWAYESLSFGGYWAWDPVENASLVPWLILLAGMHTQMIYNSTGHSLRATYFFYIISYILILYSTYLTRSGDLQDTSVHAFTNLGMNWQLRLFVLIFMIPSLTLFINRYKKIPSIAKEESSWSREFWMFIGSLVLFLSSVFIIIATSLPVINKIFGTNFTVGEDPEFPYNRIQIFVAIILGILTACTQYLKYKNTSPKYFVKKIGIPTLIALAISLAVSIFGNIDYDKYGIGFLGAIHLALFSSIYSVVANTGYIWAGLKGKLKAAGASVAHIGFGMMLVGILISSSSKEVLSINRVNPLNFGGENKEKGYENLTLFQGIRTDMGDFWATYVKDTTAENGKKMYFQILMERKDGKEKFTLYPDLIKNTKGQQGYSNNPDAKHYWNKDIFSYISYADKMQEGEDTSRFRSNRVKIGDTIFYSNGYMILNNVSVNPKNERYSFTAQDTAIMAEIDVFSSDSRKYSAKPVFYIRNNQANYVMDTVISQGLAIGLSRILDDKHIEISVKESSRLTPFVALKVYKFPYINLLWIGFLVMLTGIIMSIVRRINLV